MATKRPTKTKMPPVVPARRFYDNTMVNQYKECPRAYYLRHVRGWRREGRVPEPLAFGLAWHEAMDVIWTQYKSAKSDDKLLTAAMQAWEASWIESGHPSLEAWSFEYEERYKARTPMNALAMMKAYIEARRPMLDKAKLHAAETPFAVPIFPGDDTILYIGRIDKHIELNGDQIALEHKTTSDYKKDGGFTTHYIEGWSPNSQIEGYLHQSQHNPKPFRYVWVDASLVHKTARAFKFIPVSASMAGLDAWLWEVRDWITRIETEGERLADCPNESHMIAYPRATNSCAGKYGLCTYINICRSIPNPSQLTEPPAGFIEDRWVPFDVLGLDKIMGKGE